MSIRRNTALNLAGQIAPALVSLVVMPLYFRRVGEIRYGVLTLVWMLLGYFGMFDLGLNRAVAHRIAELRDSAAGERSRLVWTALILTGLLSVVGAVTLYFTGNHGLATCFGVGTGPQRREFLAALPWIALVMPASLIGSSLCGALQGREQFARMNLINTVGTILGQIIPMTVAYRWSVELEWLVPAALISKIVACVWMFFECWRTIPLERPRFDRSQIGSLFSFGGWVTVSSFAWPLMTTFDRFVIGTMNGAAAVSQYQSPYNIVSRSAIVPGALSSAVFPRFAIGDRAARLALLVRSTGVLAAVFTPACLGMMFLMRPILAHFLSPALANESTVVGQYIVIGVWANGLDLMPHAYLQANGKPRVSAIFHVAELLPYFVLLWIGLHFWGLVGAAAVGNVRMIADTALQYGACGYCGSDWRDLIVSCSMMIIGLAVIVLLPATTPLCWLAAAGVMAWSMAWGWRKMPEDWRRRVAPYLPGGVRA